MYHADAPADKKRPRKQPPNQVWLDAIMSKTRATEPSPRGAAPPMRMMAMAGEPTDDAGAGWQTQTMPPTARLPPHPPRPMGFGDRHAPPPVPMAPATARSSRTPSPVVAAMAGDPALVAEAALASPFADQLAVDDAALVAALTASLKDLVADQDCSFIARGLCHLCSDKEKKLVPVVNFCPDFSPTHSLCREHLRSMHRVRLVDIFAGKNQPTVSKRSLRCAVCSLSCPCSKCQLRRNAEIARYKQWLSNGAIWSGHASREPSPQDEDPAMTRRGRSRQTTPPLPPPHTSTGYDGDARGYESQASRRRHESSRRQSVEPDVSDMTYAHAEEKTDRPMYYMGGEDKAVRDIGDEGFRVHDAAAAMVGLPPAAFRADEKGPVRANRFPKRAAKESVPYGLDLEATSGAGYAPNPPAPSHGHTTLSGLRGGSADLAPDLPSPSATSVLNCLDSEKSLVDLLSSLNQRVTPAVRYFADADEPRFRDMMESTPYTYERELQETNQHTAGEVAMNGNDDYEMSMRQQKRKRDSTQSSSRASEKSSISGDYDVDDDAPLRGSGSVRSTMSSQVDQDPPSYRQKAPTPLATGDRKTKQQSRSQGVEKPPSPSPRGRPSGRTKTSTPPPDSKVVSSRKRDPPAALPPPAVSTTRKRKSDTLAAEPAASTERKTPRGSAHRGHAHKSSTANHAREIVKRRQGQRASSANDAEEAVEGDGDDESELDTNLDYCEVCLAAGDLVCCDVCPRSFHLKCLRMTEDDLPEGDWQCAECRKPSYFESFGVAVAEKTSVPDKCLQIIQCLKSHPFSKPFLLPVENVPHYTNIVKQPMDLSTIEKKLNENKYMVHSKGTMQSTSGVASKTLHLGAFADDVRLVWANCKLFNDDGSGITRAADQLSDGFEKLYQDVLDFVERTNTTGREEHKLSTSSSAPVAEAKDQDGVLSESVASGSKRSVDSSLPSRPVGEQTSIAPAQRESTSGSKSSSGGAEASNVPNGSSNVKRATLPSTGVPVSGNESQLSSSKQELSRSKDNNAERVTTSAQTSDSAASSLSPSPVTTATPSPTESKTTTFVKAQAATTSTSVREQQPLSGPVPKASEASGEQAKSTDPGKDSGIT